MKNTPCHNQLVKHLFSQKGHMDRLYNNMSKELATVLKPYKVKSNTGVWVRNSEIEKKVDKILLQFNSDLLNIISNQTVIGWNMSEDCNDKLVQGYLKGIEIESEKREALLFRNIGAVDAFLKRKTAGLNLSNRVWNLTKNSKDQLEYLLQSGITEGRPAAKLASDVKEYLKEPNRRYRRIRDKNGKLIYSEPAKSYHPGQGVYRSSHKNALRLTRDIINTAYRYSDHERVQNMDFVRGITVSLSAQHVIYDICDHLAGDYPKAFRFLGWHPLCLCVKTTKLLSKKEFVRQLNGGRISKKRYINSIPTRAEKHINSISDRIKGWSNKPYFIADNFKNTKGGFALKSHVTVK